MAKYVAVTVAAVLGLVVASWAPAQTTKLTQPRVSEKDCPAQIISVETSDHQKASAVLRKPPGKGLFPAVVFLHGGLNQRNIDRIKREAVNQPTNSRFLASGYVTAEAVFRSRSDDPQSKEAFIDCLAIIEYIRKLPEVDPKSVVVFGHSGGGSLALELAGETELAAIVAGEPASIIFTGMYNKNTRRRSDRDKLMADPTTYYTPEFQKLTRDKIAKIGCPVLIVHGDQHEINKINDQIIIPELKAAGKQFDVIAYPGQPHTFVFGTDGSPEAALKCFDDCNRFYKQFLATQPKQLAESLIRPEPVDAR